MEFEEVQSDSQKQELVSYEAEELQRFYSVHHSEPGELGDSGEL